MFDSIMIRCPFCHQKQELLVDPGGGENQDLIVDCEVCCHPLDIHVAWNEEKHRFRAEVAKGSGF